MTAMGQSENQQINHSGRFTLASWSGVAGAVLMATAIGVVVGLSPQGSDPGGAQATTEFYAQGGGHAALVVAEPLAIVAGFLLLWFVAHLTSRLEASQEGPLGYRYSTLAGGVMFVVLAFASVIVQTTMAGAMSFYESFEVDPNTAHAFSHLGYVLLVGAMAGAAVQLAAAGASIRRAPTVLPRWMGTTSYLLAALSMLSFAFVYLPAVLYLMWILVAGLFLLRRQPT